MNNKICHITTAHPAKDMRIFRKECVSLANHGFETHLIVANQKSEYNQGVQIHNIISPTSNRIQRMWKTTQIAFKKAVEIDADLYHFHDPELLPIGKKLKDLGKKVIYDAHEDLPRQILSKYYIPKLLRPFISILFEKYENYIVGKLDAILTATPFIRDRFLKINQNTVDINNFPDLENFIIPESKDKEHDVIYLGLMSKIRGIEEIVKMLEYTNASLSLIGSFQSKKEELFVKDMPTWNDVNFLGRKNRKDVADILSKSKIGIVTFLPVPNHVNAQPNKIFEYMAAGIPVVTSNFPLWKEIVEKYNTGVCVDPHDPKAIAEAVNYLLKNKAIADEMGKNGKRIIQEKFSWKPESKKLIQIYQKVLNS